jgi:hypothetical protein
MGSCLATTISVRAQSSVKLAGLVAENRRLGPAGETIWRTEEEGEGGEEGLGERGEGGGDEDPDRDGGRSGSGDVEEAPQS